MPPDWALMQNEGFATKKEETRKAREGRYPPLLSQQVQHHQDPDRKPSWESSHFSDEKTKAQRRKELCLRSHERGSREVQLQGKSPAFTTRLLLWQKAASWHPTGKINTSQKCFLLLSRKINLESGSLPATNKMYDLSRWVGELPPQTWKPFCFVE